MREQMQLGDGQAENLVHSSTVNCGGETATASLKAADTDFVLGIVPTGSPLGDSLAQTFIQWRMVNLRW